MTRAPRSASCRVAKGAATACSIETTVTPDRGPGNGIGAPGYGAHPTLVGSGSLIAFASPNSSVPPSIRSRHPQHMLGNIRQDQVGRDRRDLIEARLTELALDVVL